MKNYVLLLLLFIGLSNTLFAQEDTYEYQPRKSKYLEINGTFTCPLFDLEANNYRDAYGLSIAGYGDLTSNRKPFVWQWGLEGRVQGGGKANTYYITSPINAEIYNPTNISAGMNGLVRLKYQKSPVQPYVDGFVGGRIFTSGYYTEEYDYDEGGYTDQWNGVTTTGRWVYGVGAGVQVPVSKRVAINARTAYTHAPNTSYIDMDDFINNDRNVLNPAVRSDYDALSFHVGVSIKLDKNRNENKVEKKRDCNCECNCNKRRNRDCRRRDCRDRRSIFGIGFDILTGPTCSTPPPPCEPAYPSYPEVIEPDTPACPPTYAPAVEQPGNVEGPRPEVCPPSSEPEIIGENSGYIEGPTPSVYEPEVIEEKPQRAEDSTPVPYKPASVESKSERRGKAKSTKKAEKPTMLESMMDGIKKEKSSWTTKDESSGRADKPQSTKTPSQSTRTRSIPKFNNKSTTRPSQRSTKSPTSSRKIKG